MFKLLNPLIAGADNRILYDVKVTQIIREPINVMDPSRITDAYLQKNQVDISPVHLIESADMAIMTKCPFQAWDGKLHKPWFLKQGTVVSVNLDDNTNALYLASEVQSTGSIKENITTKFKTFELFMNASTILRFSDNAILHRIIFYDLFKYDTVNNYWRPMGFDFTYNAVPGSWITDADLGLAVGTLQAWMQQTIKINVKLVGRQEYDACKEYRKSQMAIGGDEPNIVVLDIPVSNTDEPYVYLSGDATVDWSRFRFFVLVEYSAIR